MPIILMIMGAAGGLFYGYVTRPTVLFVRLGWKEIYDNLGTTIEPLAGAIEKTLTHIGLYMAGGAAIGLILGILTVRFSRRGR